MASILVSNIPPGITRQQLEEYFENHSPGKNSVQYVLHPFGVDTSVGVVTFAEITGL